jgi:hypothetical protein
MASRQDIAFSVASLSKMTEQELNDIVDKVIKSKKGATALKSLMRSIMRSALKSAIKLAARANK